VEYDCLVVDDEIELSKRTCEYFKMFDVSATWVHDAQTCLAFFRENAASLILLDVNLGSSSGFDLCSTLRQTIDIPIIFISARTSEDDMLIGLNIGGDDYISKPYSLTMLLAKVKAVLKRERRSAANSDILNFSNICIDVKNHVVTLDEQVVELTSFEYKLLIYLVKNKNRTVSKDEIFLNIWGDSFTGDNALNVHIRHLREKLENDPQNPQFIKTVWGTGYVFKG
jgi:two-component system response regulator RegX3